MRRGEDSMVSWFEQHSKLPKHQYPIGIGDDMAQICLPEADSCLITTDMLLEGVHFDLGRATLKQVGYKAMCASLSDCAAMATVPVAAVVSVALGKNQGCEALKELHSGIIEAGDQHGCALVGGDMCAWRQATGLALSVSMISRPGPTPPITRAKAQTGDRICVTGSLGGSLTGRHLCFTPRVQEALHMARTVDIHAMMDISDGLSTDLTRMCQRSGVGALIEAKRLPLSPAARETPRPLESALHDGEDFELLFTLPQAALRRLLVDWPFDVPVTPIGEITALKRVRIQTKNGQVEDLEMRGYDHLSSGDPVQS